uniref:Eukaryotic translation initiation factor 3 subunit J n=1 Tax=Coptotermes formosanus TaxID=36987 RepID=R4UV92_COPFO|nr:eukaryotic translation initiation factor 3 subunit J [Coptotermes formosanus]
MDDEWDADTFDPQEIKTAPSVGANKWEGEDEDEDVKDNWEDEEEEEKKDVEKQEPAKPAQPKKSKKNIEEKEQRLHEEAERKGKGIETTQELTPEQLQKLQEESDLLVTMETFGVAETSTALGIEAMNPNSREEFDEFQAAISKKVQSFTKSPHFPAFAEELIRNICVNLTSHDLKKLKTTVENMFLEKSKAEKGDKAKKSKGKGKVKLKVEGEHALVNEYTYGDYDDYDEDFM